MAVGLVDEVHVPVLGVLELLAATGESKTT
jgi:hypothetical protein